VIRPGSIENPTTAPSSSPTNLPSGVPSSIPSMLPSSIPSQFPTASQSSFPSLTPTSSPIFNLSIPPQLSCGERVREVTTGPGLGPELFGALPDVDCGLVQLDMEECDHVVAFTVSTSDVESIEFSAVCSTSPIPEVIELRVLERKMGGDPRSLDGYKCSTTRHNHAAGVALTCNENSSSAETLLLVPGNPNHEYFVFGCARRDADEGTQLGNSVYAGVECKGSEMPSASPNNVAANMQTTYQSPISSVSLTGAVSEGRIANGSKEPYYVAPSLAPVVSSSSQLEDFPSFTPNDFHSGRPSLIMETTEHGAFSPVSSGPSLVLVDAPARLPSGVSSLEADSLPSLTPSISQTASLGNNPVGFRRGVPSIIPTTIRGSSSSNVPVSGFPLFVSTGDYPSTSPVPNLSPSPSFHPSSALDNSFMYRNESALFPVTENSLCWIPEQGGAVLVAITTSTNCASSLPQKSCGDLPPMDGTNAFFCIDCVKSANKFWRQDFFDGSENVFSLDWIFSDYMAMEDRFKLAASAGVPVKWKVTVTRGSTSHSAIIEGKWRWSSSSTGWPSHIDVDRGTFSSGGGCWGASPGTVDGHGTTGNPVFGQCDRRNMGINDRFGCGFYHFGSSSKVVIPQNNLHSFLYVNV